MSEKEQGIAKSIIGTLIFTIAYMIISDLSLASLAVSYANPQLSAGPFDLWTAALSVLSPIAVAYVFVTSKVGAGVVTLVTAIVNRLQSPTTSTATAIDPKRFASASKTSEVLSSHADRIKALEVQVAAWKSEEDES